VAGGVKSRWVALLGGSEIGATSGGPPVRQQRCSPDYASISADLAARIASRDRKRLIAG
jgi:hypothetical protein